MKDNPYVGPQSIGEKKEEKLYGRRNEVIDLTNLLIAERIVLLYSPSGAGKTSLLQAGLKPALEGYDFKVRRLIRVNAAPPEGVGFHRDTGNRYALSVMLSLEEGLPEAERRPLIDLVKLSLVDYLGAESKGEVLIFDQFEEVLTVDPTDRFEKTEFFEQLGEALKAKRRWAVFAMREDYLAGLDPYVNLVPTRFSNTFRLDLLKHDAAVEAIRGPASERKVDFAEPAAKALAKNLSEIRVLYEDGRPEETKPGIYVEPVQLQVVCRRLWDSLAEGTAQINESHLKGATDIDAALRDYYSESVEKAAAASGVDEREIREWFREQLITPRKTRSQVSQGEARTTKLAKAIPELLKAYVIRSDRRMGTIWYELSHDRLLTPVLVNNAEWFESKLNSTQKTAALWEQQGRSPGLLFAGAKLAEAEAWFAAAPAELTPLEREFLDASREREAMRLLKEKQEKKLKFRLVLSTLLGMLAVAVALWGLQQWTRTNQALQRSDVDTVARLWQAGRPAEALAYLSRSLHSKCFVNAVLVYRGGCSTEGDESLGWAALLLGWQQGRLPRMQIWNSTLGYSQLVFSGDGKRLLTSEADSANGKSQMWEVPDQASGSTPVGSPFQTGSAYVTAVNRDGTLVANTPFDFVNGWARVFDVSKGGKHFAFEQMGFPRELEFSSNGKYLLFQSLHPEPAVYLFEATAQPKPLALNGGRPLPGFGNFTPEGDRLIHRHAKGLTLWDLATGQKRSAVFDGSGLLSLFPAAMGPDGLVLFNDSMRVAWWDPATGHIDRDARNLQGLLGPPTITAQGGVLTSSERKVRRLSTEGDPTTMEITPQEAYKHENGSPVFTVGSSRLITVRDAETFVVRAQLYPTALVRVQAWSRDGRLFAAASPDVQVWDATPRPVESGKQVGDPTPTPYQGGREVQNTDGSRRLYLPNGFSRDEMQSGVPMPKLLSTAPPTQQLAEVRNVQPSGSALYWDGAFSPNSDHVAVVGGHPGIGELQILRASDGREVVERIYHRGGIGQVKFVADGLFVAVATDKGELSVWHTQTGTLAATIQHAMPLKGINVGVGGDRLIVGDGKTQLGYQVKFPHEWQEALADLAEVAGGLRLSDGGQLHPIPLRERHAKLNELIKEAKDPRLKALLQRWLP